ncbi:MAG TPA: phosphatase PAP2 family protein [Allosphingosinicella sp.]|jgi:membrane-associated phospholipid phosphatase
MQRVGFARSWPPQFRLLAPAVGGGVEATRERVWPVWALVLLGLVAAVDVLWLLATPVALVMPIAPLSGAAVIAVLLERFRLIPRLHMLLSGIAFMLVAWPALRIYNHLVMTTALPLADARLAGWDSALGLDWLGYMLWLDRHPILLEAMDWAYGGLIAYSAAAFVLLLLLVGVARAREFLLLFVLTALAASTIGLFFPALAAMKYYAPDPDLFHTVRPNLGTYHVAVLERLRTLAAPVLDLSHMPGLTTFPSFHTAMGVLVVWSARGSRLMFVPMLLLNALMIASTPAFGSHYFVDVLAGAGIAAAAIFLLRLLDRKRNSGS